MKQTFTILFLLFTILGFAQYSWRPGIIELKSGETLKGQVKLPSNTMVQIKTNKIFFRVNKNSKKRKFGYEELNKVYIGAYKTNLGYYEYISTSGLSKRVFKLIINGKIRLYVRTIQVGYDEGQAINVKQYYLLKDGQNIARPVNFPSEYNWHNESEIKRFKKEMSLYFSDCKDIVSFIENDLYEDYNIRLLVNDYNAICF